MASKRPAKISKIKKNIYNQVCPETGKPMVPVKMLRQNGSSGMFWMVVEDFKGKEQDLDRIIPIG